MLARISVSKPTIKRFLLEGMRCIDQTLDDRNTRQPSQKHKKHSVSGCVSETLETHSICKSSLKFQKHKKHSVSGSVSETLETSLSSRLTLKILQ